MPSQRTETPEHARLSQVKDDYTGWRRWGCYVSERAWGTVREDYSSDGDAWNYFTHDMARSKAYRWGEDAIAGLCDRYQFLVFAPAFWNHRDPILKERLFGVNSTEGNHGGDVKEYYFHVDNTPTHSYMKLLYKYPQSEFPYDELVAENRRRAGQGFEYELLDTGIFDEDRYFDITIEYAKFDEEDICIRIKAINRGPDAAPLDIIPHLWFRNQWSWKKPFGDEPVINLGGPRADCLRLVTDDARLEIPKSLPTNCRLGVRTLYAPHGGRPMFTNNETNESRFPSAENGDRQTYVKDAFHRHLIAGEDCLHPENRGTKAGIHYRFPAVPPGESAVVHLRLSNKPDLAEPLSCVDALFETRRKEADEFYATIAPTGASEDEVRIQRQALAGMLWTKQSYLFDVQTWMEGDDPSRPPPESRKSIRNVHWRHISSMRVMTMPDKWEYPWFAAWDLAFHCITLALVDPLYAKEQLWVLLFEQFQHPNGQLPAYEWEFSDHNPPVHAWAVWRVYNMDRIRSGKADRGFLERCFHKLLINFTWWVNKVDSNGNNVFEGGFLGLDNITVMDRSVKCSNGAVLEQSDATGWMGVFCLNLMRIALELAKDNPAYEAMATKFFQHYCYVAGAMKHMGGREHSMWDEEDGFFYDVLVHPDGRYQKFRVRSLVGLIPLFAVERLELDWIAPFKEFSSCFDWFVRNRPDLVSGVCHRVERDGKVTYALTIVDQPQLRRLLERVLDPAEFLSPAGIRSLSKAHQDAPFEFDGQSVGYEPAEAVSKLKGGNSNWRGPVWFPTCFLLIESLRKLGKAFGTSYTVPQPENGGQSIALDEMAREISNRLIGIFTRDANGNRPVYGGTRKFQDDPHWRDLLLFFEYFHGDNGAGLGASHQTGWTGLVASLIDEWRKDKSSDVVKAR